ncbi:multimerin-1-like [Saccostrea echinata]|uniref:multimerin-1-like n=1 Tax=Saccostrea echinata TaxID=191078 RepID=UPI002A837E06|nr:multimerin-1-like [Saccostrea echinata]
MTTTVTCSLLGILMLLIHVRCEKISPKPGQLKTFMEDYNSVAETCRSLGFVRKDYKTVADKAKKYACEPMVAFDVILKNSKSNLATKTKIVFETVDLNEGQGYNASSGIFTAPYGGLYVFDWVASGWKGLPFTALVVNGSSKSWNYVRDDKFNAWIRYRKTTVVRLNYGDKVWIEVSQGPAGLNKKYTSFYGYKL